MRPSLLRGSTKVASETTDIGRSVFYPASGLSNTFGFKIQDKQGRMHRFNCETSSLTDLITCILQRVTDDIDRKNLPQILYEDEDRDKVIVSLDNDLVAAVNHARQIGWKSLRLHLDYAGVGRRKRGGGSADFEYAGRDAWASVYSAYPAVCYLSLYGFPPCPIVSRANRRKCLNFPVATARSGVGALDSKGITP